MNTINELAAGVDLQTQSGNKDEFRNWLKSTVDIPSYLTCTEQAALLDVLSKFPILYAKSEADCGYTTLTTHKIHTGDNLPIHKRLIDWHRNKKTLFVQK